MKEIRAADRQRICGHNGTTISTVLATSSCARMLGLRLTLGINVCNVYVECALLQKPLDKKIKPVGHWSPIVVKFQAGVWNTPKRVQRDSLVHDTVTAISKKKKKNNYNTNW